MLQPVVFLLQVMMPLVLCLFIYLYLYLYLSLVPVNLGETAGLHCDADETTELLKHKAKEEM